MTTSVPPDERLALIAPALALRDWVGLSDADPWLYAVLSRHPDGAYVGGHLIASLAPHGRPGESIGYSFRTPFSWDRQYDGYVFELIGTVAPANLDASALPAEVVWPMTMDTGPDLGGPELVTMLLRCARVMQRGVPIFGRAEWRPGWTRLEYSHVGVTPGRRGDTRVADEGLRLFTGIPSPKRGPAPGSVKSQKYKTAEAWRVAIREKVLPKRTRLSADGETIAHWLGIGPTTMYRLMGRWGPHTLEDLRNGNL